MKQHQMKLTLSPSVTITFTFDSIIKKMMPNEKRGDAQKFVKTSIVMLHQAYFNHMRLTLAEYLTDLCELSGKSKASVIAVAVAYHAGKHSQ